MKSKINDRKIKLLLHKLGYLRLEIETKTEELSTHETEFNAKYYSTYADEEETPSPPPAESSDTPPGRVEMPQQPSETSEETPEESVSTPVVNEVVEPEPEDLKKIWKQIAMKTHPDKTGGNPHLTELYKRASDAYSGKKYDEIIEVAIELGLELENLSDEATKLLEKRVEELEKKLQGLQLNVLWEWATAGEEKRTKIEKTLNSYRKKKKKKK
jgi:hypothetical protein